MLLIFPLRLDRSRNLWYTENNSKIKKAITMNKYDVSKVIASCIAAPALLEVKYTYNPYFDYAFPLAMSDKLFLAVCEDDFLLDGYTVRRLRDVTEAAPKDGGYLRIHRAEGTLSRLYRPPVDVTDWKTVLTSLLSSGEILIVEQEDADPKRGEFLIGKLLRVGAQSAELRGFDADGIWDDETTTVSFSQITSITFGSRYITTFAKYLPPFPG